jgi:hypothetical protein
LRESSHLPPNELFNGNKAILSTCSSHLEVCFRGTNEVPERPLTGDSLDYLWPAVRERLQATKRKPASGTKRVHWITAFCLLSATSVRKLHGIGDRF